jgi:hypothetical protein
MGYCIDLEMVPLSRQLTKRSRHNTTSIVDTVLYNNGNDGEYPSLINDNSLDVDKNEEDVRPLLESGDLLVKDGIESKQLVQFVQFVVVGIPS